MNNVITEIKSTLEGTNSRITEAEDRISEEEYRMVEINVAEITRQDHNLLPTLQKALKSDSWQFEEGLSN